MSADAELLRQATMLLRQRAQSAGPYVWGTRDYQPCTVTDGFGTPIAGTDGEDGGEDVAEYIATVGPLVGLALAEWLSQAGADLWAHGPLCCDAGCDKCDDDLWAPHVRCALTVARLIVGESS